MGAEWEDKAIDELMGAIIDYRGKTPKKTHSGIPLITAKIIKGGRIDEPSEFVAVEEYDDWMRRGLPDVGDVLITTEAPMGEVAQLNSANVALAQRVILLRGKESVLDNSFLKFVLQSSTVQHRLRARESGTTVTGIKQKELRKVLIPTPPLADQKRIAAVLGALDDEIELNRKMNKTLEEMAQAIFKSWFVDFEPFRDGCMVDSELGPIPKGWEISSFSKIIKIWSGGTPKRSNLDYWDGEIPWYTVKDVPAESDVWCINTSAKITPKGEQKGAAKVMRAGISIVSARGTVGKLALIGTPMAMNQSCYGIEGIDGYSDLFTYFMLKNIIDDLKARSHGSVFDTITRDTFGIVKIVKPTVERADEFESVVQPVIERIRSNCLETRTLAELRDTLLPKLISGEIRVPEAEREMEKVA